MTTRILGLDIGGANLKCAHSDGVARSAAFPLWKQPGLLHHELARLCATMPPYDRIAVTMTGELCDCFETKRAGVTAILTSVVALAHGIPIRVWSTPGRFLDLNDAMRDPLPVAAANWLALSQWTARRFADQRVLLLDVGSTTTDIIYLNHGNAEPRGLNDQARLTSGELVYSGVRRTPVCAILGSDVAAEWFATTLDAYLLLAMMPENSSDIDTADGRPATRPFAHARMARMRCADGESLGLEAACGLADLVYKEQRRAILRGMKRVVTGRPAVERIVVAGSGDFLARSAAGETGWSNLPIASLGDLLGTAISQAACAYAVAMLAQGESRNQ